MKRTRRSVILITAVAAALLLTSVLKADFSGSDKSDDFAKVAAADAATGAATSDEVMTDAAMDDTATAEVPASDDISVLGFQMKMDIAGMDAGISFRTVAKVPRIGSTVTASGKTYTVMRAGIVYALDPDRSGKDNNKALDESYTLLAPFDADAPGTLLPGLKSYEGQMRTYGHIATEQAYLDVVETDDTSHVYYAVTMTNTDMFVPNTLQIRPFIVATDGTVVYAKETRITSVAKVAYTVYLKGLAVNSETHKYLYEHILHGDMLAEIYENDPSYPYYLQKEEEYGWSGIVPP